MMKVGDRVQITSGYTSYDQPCSEVSRWLEKWLVGAAGTVVELTDEFWSKLVDKDNFVEVDIDGPYGKAVFGKDQLQLLSKNFMPVKVLNQAAVNQCNYELEHMYD